MKASQKKRQTKPTTTSFRQVECHLDRLCKQMQLVHGKIRELEVRKKRAVKRQQIDISALLELKLSVLKGTYNVLYHCASGKATELEDMGEMFTRS